MYDISPTLESFQKFFLNIFQSIFFFASMFSSFKKLIHVCEMRYSINFPVYTSCLWMYVATINQLNFRGVEKRE